MLRTAVAILLICIISLTMLTGCNNDAVEITDLTYVTSIGIDRGISDKWRITFQIPIIGSNDDSESGQGEGKFNYKTLTIDVPSFYAGMDLANTNISKRISFSHTQLIVFSEELATSGLIGEFIGSIVRSREIRFSSNILVAKGSAVDFIKAFKPFVSSTITGEISSFMSETDETGYFSNLTLYDFYDCMKSTYHQPITILGAVNNGENFKENGELWGTKFNIPGDYYAGDTPRKEGNKIEILGVCTWEGDKMTGKLTGHEARLLSIAKGTFKRGTFSIKDPKRHDLVIPLLIFQARKPEYNIQFDGTKPVIHLKIKLEGDILAIQSNINYEAPEMQPILENAVESFIKYELDKTIKKTQELNCDVFKFGQKAVTHFSTIQEWEAYNWNQHYKEAKITTEVIFKIRRTEGMIESSDIIFSGGKNK